VSVICFKS